MKIIEEIKSYQPYNIQEEMDKKIILDLLEKYNNLFYRENLVAHITSSAWVINKNHDKVLLAYHNIYNSWAWLGGHNDGQEDCLKVAIKEVKEESGINNVEAVSEDIFSLEVLSVDSHMKKGKYVPTHLHLNVTYLLMADENEKLSIKEDENSGVAWFYLDEVKDKSNEVWFNNNIYKKLNEKLRKMYEGH